MAVFGRWKKDRRYRRAEDFGKMCKGGEVPDRVAVRCINPSTKQPETHDMIFDAFAFCKAAYLEAMDAEPEAVRKQIHENDGQTPRMALAQQRAYLEWRRMKKENTG